MNAQVKEQWPVEPIGAVTGAAPKVYAAIIQVMRAVGKEGISKDRNNQQQGYKFRGIDDVYNALNGLMATANLCILPRVLKREVTERQTKNGGALFYVVLDMDFDFISAEDGSRHTVSVVGEAMDSGDKATNKAMSAAYKYACMEAFCIPTEGDNDADSHIHDVAPRIDPKDELGANVDPELAFKASVKMRELLEMDVQHDVKALKIFDQHDVLAKDSDLYVAASKLLKTKERSDWKAYVAEAKAKEKEDRAVSNVGRRF